MFSPLQEALLENIFLLSLGQCHDGLSSFIQQGSLLPTVLFKGAFACLLCPLFRGSRMKKYRQRLGD